MRADLVRTRPRPLRGKFISALFNIRISKECLEYARRAAVYDSDPIARTEAIRLLAFKKALPDELILRLIDPKSRSDLATPRDTNWAVQGTALAMIIRQFEGGREPSDRLLASGLALLTDAQTGVTEISTALQPLASMRADDARRVLRAIALHLPAKVMSDALQRAIQKASERMEFRTAAEERLALTKAPARPFFSKSLAEIDRPRYEANMQVPSWGDAVLIAANEREGQTLYQQACTRSAVSMLVRQRLAGNTVGFQAKLPHEAGGRRTVTLVTISDTGPKAAAAVIDDILEWNIPKFILFVGCAGEITAKHRTPPSKPLVVVARQVIDRDPSVIGTTGNDYGMRGYPSSEELLNWVRSLTVEGAFKELDVRVDKDVASGSSFVSDGNSPEHRAIVTRFGSEVLFVEMEGAGGFHQISRPGAQGPQSNLWPC